MSAPSDLKSNTALDLDEINASVALITANPIKTYDLAPVKGCANPAIFVHGSYNILAWRLTNGTIVFEVVDDAITRGGRATVVESAFPLTFVEFVNCCRRDSGRMIRVCDLAAGGLHVVAGKRAPAGGEQFAKIKARVRIEPVAPIELVRIFHAWGRETKRHARAAAKRMEHLAGRRGGQRRGDAPQEPEARRPRGGETPLRELTDPLQELAEFLRGLDD